MLETIAFAKDNLPKLIYQVQGSEPVVLTRRGAPVAVLQSYEQYQATQARVAAGSNWFSRAMQWRVENIDLIAEINLTDAQVDSWRSGEMPHIAPPSL
jgi:prevent-host-death family protein